MSGYAWDAQLINSVLLGATSAAVIGWGFLSWLKSSGKVLEGRDYARGAFEAFAGFLASFGDGHIPNEIVPTDVVQPQKDGGTPCDIPVDRLSIELTGYRAVFTHQGVVHDKGEITNVEYQRGLMYPIVLVINAVNSEAEDNARCEVVKLCVPEQVVYRQK